MTQDEVLVGMIALTMAASSASFAVGPWSAPYQLRSIASVELRYGKSAARIVWLLIAVISATSSLAILSGTRPSYATPTRAVMPR